MSVEMMGEMPEHGINAKFVFQKGLTGSTGYVFPANKHETAPPSRRGTRITHIGRIVTDLFVSASSAQSAFYRIPSAFIRVYLRLIFVSLSDRIQKIIFKLFMLSSTISVTTYDKATASRFSTRMTRIARIFTDLRAFKLSEFHYIVHALSGQLSWTHFREIIYFEEEPQRAQRTQRKRQSSLFFECSLVPDSLSPMKSKCPFFLLTNNIWRIL